MSKRRFDIVVWGATGYTGKLISEYLAGHAEENKIKWAIAGRNKEKLEKLKEDITKYFPNAKNTEILIGDLEKQNTIDEIAKQTKVILSAVGPYLLYGKPIVDACARLGTHYCDLSGEPPWIKNLNSQNSQFLQAAKNSGSIIVTSCGLDSIPDDLGVFLVADYVKKKYGSECESIRCIWTKLKGGISGGTISSIATVLSTMSGREITNPYYLVPSEANPYNVRQPSDIIIPRYDFDAKLWRYPNILSASESRFVRRSQYFLGYRYGNIKLSVTSGTKSFIYAVIASTIIVVLYILMYITITRKIILTVFPPGQGPSLKSLPNGEIEILFLAEPKSKSPGVPKIVKGRMSARGDPGYLVTSYMICESAICLATQQKELLAKEGGVYTPSSSMGHALIQRLLNAGILFEVEDPK